MSGALVLIVVLVLLTTRTRKGRRRWRKSLAWCWWMLASVATLLLPKASPAHGKPLGPSTRTAPAPIAPRVIRERRRLWPAPPRRRKVDPSAPRPGQGPRYFTSAQKQELLRIAGYQCQRTLLGVRCYRRTQLRADHRHPYSWGGKTIMENGQILCDPCNVDKGAHFTDVHDQALLELVCVEHMLPRNRFRRRARV